MVSKRCSRGQLWGAQWSIRKVDLHKTTGLRCRGWICLTQRLMPTHRLLGNRKLWINRDQMRESPSTKIYSISKSIMGKKRAEGPTQLSSFQREEKIILWTLKSQRRHWLCWCYTLCIILNCFHIKESKKSSTLMFMTTHLPLLRHGFNQDIYQLMTKCRHYGIHTQWNTTHAKNNEICILQQNIYNWRPLFLLK